MAPWQVSLVSDELFSFSVQMQKKFLLVQEISVHLRGKE